MKMLTVVRSIIFMIKEDFDIAELQTVDVV